ncbi:MAG: tetratricopeptide repeat protein [Hyphomicrobiaceae bacterium]
MAREIFISYSSKHRDLTRQLAADIEAQYGAGAVWWDHALESRAAYAQQIKAALEEARVIVIVWTAGAMISDYVYAEAVRAQEGNKLVNVRPVDMAFRDVPEPFNIYHIDDAEDRDRVLATIAKVMGGTPIPTRVPLHELYFRQHGHRIIDPKRRPLAHDPGDMSPTELLQAKYEVVPFIDVNDTKAECQAWCTNAARLTAGRLVHGAGGLGKTRLMIDVATALRAQGWTAGFLERPHEQVEATLGQRAQALNQLIAHGEDAGLLIVMDYAEGRTDEVKAIARQLANRSAAATRPIRIVLLTRGAGDWWTALSDETPDIEKLFRREDRTLDVVALPVISSGEQRLKLFVKCVEALAPLLHAQRYVLPTAQPNLVRLQRIETGEGYARPLAIQMEALLYLTSAAPQADVSGIDALLRKVLGIERDHWKKLIGVLDHDRARDMSRAVAQVTAVQGVKAGPSAERLLMGDKFYGARTAREHVDPVLRNLIRVYGKTDGGVAHLEPDLIGEHHVASIGDVELIEGCLRWIASEPEVEREIRRRSFLTVLQRATQPEHGAKANEHAASLLDHIISHYATELAQDLVTVALDTPGNLPRLLAKAAPHLSSAAIEALFWAMPTRSLKLDEAAVALAIKRAESNADADTEAPTTRAEQFANLGHRLSNLGRNLEAKAATLQAVNIYRSLASVSPYVFLPNLALTLNNLGWACTQVGCYQEAVLATAESIKIYRSIAETRRNALLPDRAYSLNNHGLALAKLGRYEEAMVATNEAVSINRSLAKVEPPAYLNDLASSLNNMAGHLASLGRFEEALAATQESVNIRRPLAKERPDAFLPGLARSLNGMGNCLSSLGRHGEALEATNAAIDIYRSLATNRPDAFLSDFAMSLNNICSILFFLNRLEDALSASKQAVDIYRPLARVLPDVFSTDLAGSLNKLANTLAGLGRSNEAESIASEGFAILEPFLVRYPGVHDALAGELRHKFVRSEDCATP